MTRQHPQTASTAGRWPSIVRRQVHAGDATVLWDTAVYVFLLGLPVLLLLAWFDTTEVNGEPRWIKPIKFFLSIALYNLNLEWLFRVFRSQQTATVFNRVRWVIATGLLIEAALIVIQAARGVQSHFNVATPLDSAIFGLMGVTITVVVLAALYSGLLIFKARRLAPPVVAEATVLAIVIMTLGSFQGFTMTSPTSEQLDQWQQGVEFRQSGSHFVGAAPSNVHKTLPVVGWSLDIGDLRIPHFIGLHALQFLLVLALLLHAGRVPAARLIVRCFAASYVALFAFSLLRAQSGLPLM